MQTGGAGGTSVLATWTLSNALLTQLAGRTWTGVASRNVQLIREGQEYGEHNLNQLDLRVGKRFDFGRTRVRVDLDMFNIFNSSWPFTVNNTYSTTPGAANQWQRPTNVLTHRFVKIGGQFSLLRATPEARRAT